MRPNCSMTDHICASIVPLFRSLDCCDLRKINSLIRKQDYSKGSLLFSKGDKANHLYIVRHGKVKIFEMAKDGRQQTVRILLPGDFFGELALFLEEQNYFVNAETLEDTGLCLLAKNDLKKLLKETPEITLGILETMSDRLARAEEIIGSLSLKSAEERIAGWLLATAEKEGIPTQAGVRLDLALPRHELANLLGLSRETLSRKLTKLQQEGLIATKGQKQIFVLNKNKLAQMVQD